MTFYVKFLKKRKDFDISCAGKLFLIIFFNLRKYYYVQELRDKSAKCLTYKHLNAFVAHCLYWVLLKRVMEKTERKKHFVKHVILYLKYTKVILDSIFVFKKT